MEVPVDGTETLVIRLTSTAWPLTVAIDEELSVAMVTALTVPVCVAPVESV